MNRGVLTRLERQWWVRWERPHPQFGVMYKLIPIKIEEGTDTEGWERDKWVQFYVDEVWGEDSSWGIGSPTGWIASSVTLISK